MPYISSFLQHHCRFTRLIFCKIGSNPFPQIFSLTYIDYFSVGVNELVNSGLPGSESRIDFISLMYDMENPLPGVKIIFGYINNSFKRSGTPFNSPKRGKNSHQ